MMDKVNIGFIIDTKVLDKDLIQQSLVDNTNSVISSWVIDTKEKQLRDTLISLGWTPPDESKRSPIYRSIRHKADTNNEFGVYKISDCGYNANHLDNISWMVHIKSEGIDRHLILLKSDYEFCD